MLVRVSDTRDLGILHPVAAKMLNRDEGIQRIMEMSERDLPEGLLESQGDLLTALELIPPDYPFVEGIQDLLKRQIAGFYDPRGDAMFLLDDMSGPETEETLAHELVHALQDQHYDLGTLLEYKAGEGDRLTATHALAEGDATAAMFDVAQPGASFGISRGMLQVAMVGGMALTGSNLDTPRSLRAALAAPYIDGFVFVQALRKRGGWADVDAAWRRLPRSSEQLLHLDKYDADEGPITVAAPSIGALGSGWTVADADTFGEQGLRIALEEWTDNDTAQRAAAGWGGDRYVVARRARGEGRDVAVAWHVVFDTDGDAGEAASVFAGSFGKACRERDDLGAMAWRRNGAHLIVVAGPVSRKSGPVPKGQCPAMVRWLDALAPPTP